MVLICSDMPVGHIIAIFGWIGYFNNFKQAPDKGQVKVATVQLYQVFVFCYFEDGVGHNFSYKCLYNNKQHI